LTWVDLGTTSGQGPALGTRATSPRLDAAEYHAAWGAQQLELIGQAVPGGPWTADLDECRYESGGRILRVGLLGSYDTDGQTWLWGWANPGQRGGRGR
jgi:hypothetical protein